MPRVSCWPVSASVERSISSTASATSGSAAGSRRRWPASSRRWRSAGPRPPASRRSRSPRAEATVAEPLRRAGAGTLADGSQLVWSVADGHRGRRWRAVAGLNGVITHALLLEVDVAGRPAKLELATPAGLLTLHPEEGSGRLHGNVVTEAGVRHLA